MCNNVGKMAAKMENVKTCDKVGKLGGKAAKHATNGVAKGQNVTKGVKWDGKRAKQATKLVKWAAKR